MGSNHKGDVYNYGLADTDVQITQGDLFLINTGSGNPGTFTTTSVVPTNIVLYGFGRVGRLIARMLVQSTGPGNYFRLSAIVIRKA